MKVVLSGVILFAILWPKIIYKHIQIITFFDGFLKEIRTDDFFFLKMRTTQKPSLDKVDFRLQNRDLPRTKCENCDCSLFHLVKICLIRRYEIIVNQVLGQKPFGKIYSFCKIFVFEFMQYLAFVWIKVQHCFCYKMCST